jgi:hypothetical protein
MARATNSLPVPLSPVITTEADEGANRSMATINRRIASERPKRGPIPTPSANRGRDHGFSLRASRLPTILVSTTLSPLKFLGTSQAAKNCWHGRFGQRKLKDRRSAKSRCNPDSIADLSILLSIFVADSSYAKRIIG